MKNSYYVITLASKSDLKRLDDFKALSKTKESIEAKQAAVKLKEEQNIKLTKSDEIGSELPRDILQIRTSLDGTKVLVQGEISDELLAHIGGKQYIEYLGDCLEDGQADESVYKYLDKHASEWEAVEPIKDVKPVVGVKL